ncbi:MAG: PTH1 family peptidyl-tRNA hydrolase [Myxococcota bacterium]|jgi:PTH1 family peptidyl-tRNA hydrolase
MKLLVGIGNPGSDYEGTRHNVGFHVLEAFAERHGLAFDSVRYAGVYAEGTAVGCDVALIKPETYVNRSGEAVSQALAGLPAVDVSRDLVVVYDDLDLPLGRIRLRKSGGAGGHRGMANIIETLGHRDFTRLRFGVGRPPAGVAVRDFVLEPFAGEDHTHLAARTNEAVRALEAILGPGIDAAMSEFNRDAQPQATNSEKPRPETPPAASAGQGQQGEVTGWRRALSGLAKVFRAR